MKTIASSLLVWALLAIASVVRADPDNASLAEIIAIGETHDYGALNVVITGDGFQNNATDKQLLVDRANRWYAAMTNANFLGGYKAMINFWVLWVPSTDSGITITDTGKYPVATKNTAYSMSYDQRGTMLIGNMQTSWLNTKAPWRDVTVYVTKSAGPVSEGFFYAWGAFNNRYLAISLESESSSNEPKFITTIGAAFANLASENVRGAMTADELDAANISSTTTPAVKTTLKWGELIGGTVQTDTYTVSGGVTYINWNDGTGSQADTANFPAPVLGAFDVNHTTQATVTTVKPYRNSLFAGNGLVNYWYLGIGQVHTEAFVHSLYKYADPISTETPAAASTITTRTDVTISPRAISTLHVRWYMDGTPIANATANTYTVDPSTLATGSHTLKAEVYDSTTQVRASYAADLTGNRTWTVTGPSAPPPPPPPNPSTGGGSGGGGGAPSDWFFIALVMLGVGRGVRSKFNRSGQMA